MDDTTVTLRIIERSSKPEQCTISLQSPVRGTRMPRISVNRAIRQGDVSRTLHVHFFAGLLGVDGGPREELMYRQAGFDDIDAFVAGMGRMTRVRRIVFNLRISHDRHMPEVVVAARYVVAILRQLPTITGIFIRGTFGDIPPDVFSTEIPATIRAVHWNQWRVSTPVFAPNSAADARFFELVGSHATHVSHNLFFGDVVPCLPATVVLYYASVNSLQHSIHAMSICPNLEAYCVRIGRGSRHCESSWLKDRSGSHAKLALVWGATERISTDIRTRYPMLKPAPACSRMSSTMVTHPVPFSPATSYLDARMPNGPTLGSLLGAFFIGMERVRVDGTDPAALECVARYLTSTDGVEGPECFMSIN
jgi:hypothetical protein